MLTNYTIYKRYTFSSKVTLCLLKCYNKIKLLNKDNICEKCIYFVLFFEI
jgi:hypothetical protein